MHSNMRAECSRDINEAGITTITNEYAKLLGFLSISEAFMDGLKKWSPTELLNIPADKNL